MNNQATKNLTFAEIRELQRLIIKQNQVITSDTASQSEKDEASRIKLDAFLKLGIDPSPETSRKSHKINKT